ncbi:flagellar hook assembly protein FlgD [Desulfolutivibrio sulfoxidireducens]|uniref:flagellar hook assembly protein FlgD n=1 Tax=Desulfolutivibrio sulfoxidireducens TaxID=2773299 RepID=UPI00159DCBF5|nr:flagellar hook capping FlgD N-terminal domain-containing protein [Desulfolutivibrio sulfoxidireducens]QLA16655.1 flagellar hook assembly protein FlgD [Desulfolutivibrio sulfoxidireducens]QLA19466.1 flagellar hook assembly protein FlgD [Desulfolutivibrio sulfoxidireducens]
MSTVSSVLSSYGTDTSTTTTDSSTELGKEAFLQLLLTQLTYQDPLDPMDDQDFVAELAQFSSLEQLTNINTGIEELNDTVTQEQLFDAVQFIGKEIKASGETIQLEDGEASTIYYTVATDAEEVVANVLDEDGNVVRTVDIGAETAGDYEFVWDGMDSDGNVMDDGVYTVTILTQDADGNASTASTQIQGTVTGVESSDGTYYLRVGDVLVDFTNITEVVDSDSSTTTEDS